MARVREEPPTEHQVIVYKSTPCMNVLMFLSFVLIILLCLRINSLENKILDLNQEIFSTHANFEAEIERDLNDKINFLIDKLSQLERKVDLSTLDLNDQLDDLGIETEEVGAENLVMEENPRESEEKEVKQSEEQEKSQQQQETKVKRESQEGKKQESTEKNKEEKKRKNQKQFEENSEKSKKKSGKENNDSYFHQGKKKMSEWAKYMKEKVVYGSQKAKQALKQGSQKTSEALKYSSEKVSDFFGDLYKSGQGFFS